VPGYRLICIGRNGFIAETLTGLFREVYLCKNKYFVYLLKYVNNNQIRMACLHMMPVLLSQGIAVPQWASGLDLPVVNSIL
jgi:hypothetical protein